MGTRSFLIAVEGVDGCGKTGLSKYLATYLTNLLGSSVKWAKEPTFSSQEADKLNAIVGSDLDSQIKREEMFLQSRLS